MYNYYDQFNNVFSVSYKQISGRKHRPKVVYTYQRTRVTTSNRRYNYSTILTNQLRQQKHVLVKNFFPWSINTDEKKLNIIIAACATWNYCKDRTWCTIRARWKCLCTVGARWKCLSWLTSINMNMHARERELGAIVNMITRKKNWHVWHKNILSYGVTVLTAITSNACL